MILDLQTRGTPSDLILGMLKSPAPRTFKMMEIKIPVVKWYRTILKPYHYNRREPQIVGERQKKSEYIDRRLSRLAHDQTHTKVHKRFAEVDDQFTLGSYCDWSKSKVLFLKEDKQWQSKLFRARSVR